jgi:putative peptide zinc metalloprotease protein
MLDENYHTWICPDLRQHWQLVKVRNPEQYVLCSMDCSIQWEFSTLEGQALRYFTGQFTLEQVQWQCQKECDSVTSTLMLDLIQRLIERDILQISESESKPSSSIQLKSVVQWFRQRDGFWILRNPEDVTRQLQVSDRHKQVLDLLTHLTPAQVIQQGVLASDELRPLLQQLAIAGMLVGIDPPIPPKRKLTPLQFLFFSVPLGNPDRWLSQSIHSLHWVWTRCFGLCLFSFLVLTSVYGWQHQREFWHTAIAVWTQRNLPLTVLFGLLSLLVISLHELGHAFTLKHYNRIVPQVGLMFMMLFPAAYVNTTDQYALTRMQRSLVVGAGVLCQITLAAIGFWIWQITPVEAWLHTVGFLLTLASLFTVVVNLNPLAKFDGYYLAVALTGINNLRSRSFGLYAQLLRLQVPSEKLHNAWILALYAPFSLVYSLSVFGFLLLYLTGWTFTHIPAIALLILILWAIYFYTPTATAR